MAETRACSSTGGGTEKCSNVGDQVLLPGIPDEITLDRICAKLPWKAFSTLCSVSPAWRQAIQSHRVHESRARSHSAESVLVHNHYLNGAYDVQVVALYSKTDGQCYELPRIPGVERGIPWASECVALDGKIYVIGGAAEYDDEESYGFGREVVDGGGIVLRGINSEDEEEEDEKEVYREVYAFDLAGQGKWTQCASMQDSRHRFACGVMNGKIYVFGGRGPRRAVHGSEVFDPKTNAWASVKPMASLRLGGHRVAAVGEELAVYGGLYNNEELAKYVKEHHFEEDEWGGYDFKENALSLEVYHPGRDEWRTVEPFLKRYIRTRTVFDAREKLHMMTAGGVGEYDKEKNAWKSQQTNSFDVLGPEDAIKVEPTAAVFVGEDELFAGVVWYRNDDRRSVRVCLMEGRGFGSEDTEITWQVLATCRCDFEEIMYAMAV